MRLFVHAGSKTRVINTLDLGCGCEKCQQRDANEYHRKPRDIQRDIDVCLIGRAHAQGARRLGYDEELLGLQRELEAAKEAKKRGYVF